MRPAFALALAYACLLLGAGCTASNPDYVAAGAAVVDAAAYRPDLSRPDLADTGDLGTYDWLSDHKWTSGVSGWGPIEKDRSNGEQAAGDGKTITIAGVKYAKGLGVHALADVRFPLARQYRAFATDVGVDDEVMGNGSVVFQVFADGVKLFDSGVVRGGQPARSITVSVANAGELRLVVGDGGDGPNSDHADWAGARLLR